jgi:molybdopterin converting factor small subunit
MVIVHYWAAARAAAGCAEEKIEAGTVGELVAAITREHEMDRIVKACSLLVGLTNRIESSAMAPPLMCFHRSLGAERPSVRS